MPSSAFGTVVPVKDLTFDREIYRTRNLIERLINRLKHFRRVATRYEKLAENYRAMLTLAAIKIWLCFANRP